MQFIGLILNKYLFELNSVYLQMITKIMTNTIILDVIAYIFYMLN